MHLFAHLLPLLATLLAVTQATDGDDLARQICRTYNRPSKLYCVSQDTSLNLLPFYPILIHSR